MHYMARQNRLSGMRYDMGATGGGAKLRHNAPNRAARGRAGSPAWLTTSHTLFSASLKANASTHTSAT